MSRGVNDAAARVKNTLARTQQVEHSLCVCDGGNEAHFLSAADSDSYSHAAANGTVRTPTSVPVHGGRQRPRWAETEVLSGRTSQSMETRY